MANIIKVSEATAIALHGMALLVHMPRGKPLSVKQIAGTLGISADHLSKIMQRLEKERLVRSVRGPKGGFLPVEAAGRLPMLRIFEIFEGPISFSGCLMRRTTCKEESCSLSVLLCNLQNMIVDFLRKTSIKDIRPFDAALMASDGMKASRGKQWVRKPFGKRLDYSKPVFTKVKSYQGVQQE